MGEHLENALKCQLLFHAEEEVSPEPSIVTHHTMRCTLSPEVERTQQQSQHVACNLYSNQNGEPPYEENLSKRDLCRYLEMHQRKRDVSRTTKSMISQSKQM